MTNKKYEYNFNYNGKEYHFKDYTDLWFDFIIPNFDYKDVETDDNYMEIKLEDGNSIKIKLL